MFLDPGDLSFPVLMNPLESYRASRVPGMMCCATVGTAVANFLLLLVEGEAFLRPVASAADPTGDSSAAVVLVVTVPLTAEATEGLAGVWAEVVRAPVPQVYVRR